MLARGLPFHSDNPMARRVFHNNDGCAEGQRIAAVDWRAGEGAGDRTLCERCARLNAADQRARDAT